MIIYLIWLQDLNLKITKSQIPNITHWKILSTNLPLKTDPVRGEKLRHHQPGNRESAWITNTYMCVYLYITTFYTNTFALTWLLKESFKEYFWKTVRLDKKKLSLWLPKIFTAENIKNPKIILFHLELKDKIKVSFSIQFILETIFGKIILPWNIFFFKRSTPHIHMYPEWKEQNSKGLEKLL